MSSNRFLERQFKLRQQHEKKHGVTLSDAGDNIFKAIDREDIAAIEIFSKTQMQHKHILGYPPLFYAIFNKKTKAARRLVELGADINTPFRSLTNPGAQFTVLGIASAIGDLSFLDFLLSRFDPIRDKSCLHQEFCHVVRHDSLSVMETFLNRNCLTLLACLEGYIMCQTDDIKDSEKKSRLLFSKITEMAKHTEFETFEGRSDYINTFREVAKRYNKNDSIKQLGDQLFTIANSRKHSNSTNLAELLLSIACKDPESISRESVDFLLEKKVDIELPSYSPELISKNTLTKKTNHEIAKGMNALTIAATHGNVNYVKKLLAMKANVNTRVILYPASLTPGKTPEIPQQMQVSSEAKVNEQAQLLIEAIREDKEKSLQRAKAPAVRQKNERIANGANPLIMTLITKDSVDNPQYNQIIDALLQAKPNLDATDVIGQTALMYAVERSNVYAVRALIAAGANIEVESYTGATAISLAKIQQNQEIIGLIRKREKAIAQEASLATKDEDEEEKPSESQDIIAPAAKQLAQFTLFIAAKPAVTLKEKLTPLEALLKETPEHKDLLAIKNNYDLLRQLLEFVPDAALPLSPQLIAHRNAMLGTLGRLLRQINHFVEDNGRGTQLLPKDFAKKLANIQFHSHGTVLAKVITRSNQHKNLNKKVIALVKLICDLMDDSSRATEKLDLIEKSKETKYQFLKQLLETQKSHDPTIDETYDQLTLARRELYAYQKIPSSDKNKAMLEMAMHYTNARINTYVDTEMLSSLEEQPDYEKIKHGKEKGHLFRHPELPLEPLPDFFWQTAPSNENEPSRPPSPK